MEPFHDQDTMCLDLRKILGVTKKPKIALKVSKSPYFFHFWKKLEKNLSLIEYWASDNLS